MSIFAINASLWSSKPFECGSESTGESSVKGVFKSPSKPPSESGSTGETGESMGASPRSIESPRRIRRVKRLAQKPKQQGNVGRQSIYPAKDGDGPKAPIPPAKRQLTTAKKEAAEAAEAAETEKEIEEILDVTSLEEIERYMIEADAFCEDEDLGLEAMAAKTEKSVQAPFEDLLVIVQRNQAKENARWEQDFEMKRLWETKGRNNTHKSLDRLAEQTPYFIIDLFQSIGRSFCQFFSKVSSCFYSYNPQASRPPPQHASWEMETEDDIDKSRELDLLKRRSHLFFSSRASEEHSHLSS